MLQLVVVVVWGEGVSSRGGDAVIPFEDDECTSSYVPPVLLTEEYAAEPGLASTEAVPAEGELPAGNRAMLCEA